MRIKIITFIRNTCVEYLCQNESLFRSFADTRYPWEQYLTMLQQPTTSADHICVVAVACTYNIIINIIESLPTFNPVTVINQLNSIGSPRPIIIGHISENHYVSTRPISTKIQNYNSANGRHDFVEPPALDQLPMKRNNIPDKNYLILTKKHRPENSKDSDKNKDTYEHISDACQHKLNTRQNYMTRYYERIIMKTRHIDNIGKRVKSRAIMKTRQYGIIRRKDTDRSMARTRYFENRNRRDIKNNNTSLNLR